MTERITMRRKLVPKLAGSWVRYELVPTGTHFLFSTQWYVRMSIGRWAQETDEEGWMGIRKSFAWTTMVFVKTGAPLLVIPASAKEIKTAPHSDVRPPRQCIFDDLGMGEVFRRGISGSRNAIVLLKTGPEVAISFADDAIRLHQMRPGTLVTRAEESEFIR